MYIGFQCNCPLNEDPRNRLKSSSINRIALIDAHVRRAGLRVFVYSPQHIRASRTTVPGYLFECGEFIPTTADVPLVNGNWTRRTRRLLAQGMGYDAFGRWVEERRIGIYVPHAFSELLGNKYETYKLVRGFHDTLHPHCEPYRHSLGQLEHFVETSRMTFLKPRSGSGGDRIITLKREATGLTITHHRKKVRRTYRAKNLRAAVEFVRRISADKKRYVIQHGVETMRVGGSAFDIRVTMLHDGRTWSWLHEARRSPEGSDVSNVRQGGEIAATEDVLFEVLGPEAAHHMLHELESESFGFAAYLERLHPGDILEVAFDYAIDRDGRLRLLEVNTKPGMAGIGSEITIFDKRPEHEPLFERWVYPHATSLARFLEAKAERVRVGEVKAGVTGDTSDRPLSRNHRD